MLTVADPGEGLGGPPPYFFGNSAFSLKCQNYLRRIQHSLPSGSPSLAEGLDPPLVDTYSETPHVSPGLHQRSTLAFWWDVLLIITSHANNAIQEKKCRCIISYRFIWEDMSKIRAFICSSVSGTRNKALTLAFDILHFKYHQKYMNTKEKRI